MNPWLRLNRRKSRQKSTTLDDDDVAVDRISALPDPILGIILSFLPLTKDAIATSILSKRWRFMWKSVHNLSFFQWVLKEGQDTKFIEFVNRVLLLHDPTLLNKFMLFWKPRCNVLHLRSWIETGITRNVPKLVLDVETRVGPGFSPAPIQMPTSVFSSESLRHLVLDGGICFSEADVVCLPRLERLELLNVDFESHDVFQKLVSGCPVLDFLHIHVDVNYRIDYFGRGSGFDDVSFTYMIFSTSLKRLEASFRYKEDESGDNIFSCSLMLATPSLEAIVVQGFIFDIKVLERLSCLVEARFALSDADLDDSRVCDSMVKVVRAFDCAKLLVLSDDTMWVLSRAKISLSTEFKKLVILEMMVDCCHCCVALRDFIQYCDNLQVLRINQVRRGNYHLHHTDWNAPTEVPRCLSNSLKKVEFDVYSGTADEREVIRYMLKHGSVLEVMEITCERHTAKFELVREICKFPRKSCACEVEFLIDQYVPDGVVTSQNSPYDWNENLQMWLRCNATGGINK